MSLSTYGKPLTSSTSLLHKKLKTGSIIAFLKMLRDALVAKPRKARSIFEISSLGEVVLESPI